jgi:hypothetical protein
VSGQQMPSRSKSYRLQSDRSKRSAWSTLGQPINDHFPPFAALGRIRFPAGSLKIGGVFTSRQAGRLTYQSQSADQIDRTRDRTHSLETRLWPGKGRPRPRGRNRECLAEAWEQADTAFENMFAATIMRVVSPDVV